jgi:hypothetical protein
MSPHSAAEREKDNFRGFKDVCLKMAQAKAIVCLDLTIL